MYRVFVLALFLTLGQSRFIFPGEINNEVEDDVVNELELFNLSVHVANGEETLKKSPVSSVLWHQEPRGLFTNFTLMPEYLARLGYKTHAVGKWHLGFCHTDYLPTNRGFDTFRGFYGGSQGYYTHRVAATVGGGPPGYDYRDNTDIDLSANGTYTSDLITRHSIDVIRNHVVVHQHNPLFLYIPYQDVHSPLEVPKKYSDMYPGIQNQARKIYSGKVSAMDASVGKIVNALKDSGLYNNSVIIFTADNGGQTLSGGNNFPLRGNKGTIWEGGTRSAAFVHSPLLMNLAGTISNEYIQGLP